MNDPIDRDEGAALFGYDPAAYDAARPAYPGWVFERLLATGALFPGASTIEIGPGAGNATRRLVAGGANPLILVEPDARFTPYLQSIALGARLQQARFEDAELAVGAVDLIVAATAFHWIDPSVGYEKAHRLLKPGGVLALIWNVFQVVGADDPFHDATASILEPLAVSPSGAPDTLPFALDRKLREAEARRVGFASCDYQESTWSVTLTTTEVVALYEGYATVQRLPPDERQTLLDRLADVATNAFGGRVVRNITTCLYRMTR